MGFYIIKNKNSKKIICKSFDKEKAEELEVFCCFIEFANAKKALEKLEKAGLEDYDIARGYCPKHFDYNERVKHEYPDEKEEKKS